MKKILTDNIGMKLLSLCLAALTWIVILNYDDPAITKNFTIAVEIINEEAIETLDKVYKVVEGDVVSFTVKGNRSKVDTLRATDFRAVADLSKISMTNAVPIDVDPLKFANELVITLGKVNTMKLSLEERVYRDFAIKFKENGTLPKGYALGDLYAKPDKISVSGADSVMKTISEIRVEVDVSNYEEDFKIDLEPRAVDNNGYVVDSDILDFSHDQIKVSGTVLNTKTVDIVLSIVGEPEEGYQVINSTCELKEVVIAGRAEDLNEISSIVINRNVIGINHNIQEDVLINEYIPYNVRLVDDTQMTVLNIQVEKLEFKELNLVEENIEIRALPTTMRVNFIENNVRVVKVTGLKNNLDNFTVNDLNPYIDLTDFDIGVHYVDVYFDIQKDVKVLLTIRVNIELTSIYDIPIINGSEDSTNVDSTTDSENTTSQTSENTTNQTDEDADENEDTETNNDMNEEDTE